MDINEEFDSLELPRAKQSLAWDARARIIWGDPAAEVQTSLVANGIDQPTAERIVAIVVRERALAIRTKGVRDFVIGLLVCVGSTGVWIGAIMFVKLGLAAVPAKGMGVIVAVSVLASMYGVLRTWRGLARIIGGSRVKGAVSDVDNWLE